MDDKTKQIIVLDYDVELDRPKADPKHPRCAVCGRFVSTKTYRCSQVFYDAYYGAYEHD